MTLGRNSKEKGSKFKLFPSANWGFSIGYSKFGQKRRNALPAKGRPNFTDHSHKNSACCGREPSREERFDPATPMASTDSDFPQEISAAHRVDCCQPHLPIALRAAVVMAGLVPAIHAAPLQRPV